MRYFFVALGLMILAVFVAAGWRGHYFSKPPIEVFTDMVRQPKVLPQTPSDFFPNGRSARRSVEGTVPLGYAMPSSGEQAGVVFSSGPEYMATGRIGAQWGAGFPMPVTKVVMEQGQETFGIYCAACHGETGAGNGMAFRYGLATVQSLLQPRIREMPEGEIFNTITHGKNTMFGLGSRIPVPERWAVIAYLRALQKSQGGATIDNVPAAEREKLGQP